MRRRINILQVREAERGTWKVTMEHIKGIMYTVLDVPMHARSQWWDLYLDWGSVWLA